MRKTETKSTELPDITRKWAIDMFERIANFNIEDFTVTGEDGTRKFDPRLLTADDWSAVNAIELDSEFRVTSVTTFDPQRARRVLARLRASK